MRRDAQGRLGGAPSARRRHGVRDEFRRSSRSVPLSMDLDPTTSAPRALWSHVTGGRQEVRGALGRAGGAGTRPHAGEAVESRAEAPAMGGAVALVLRVFHRRHGFDQCAYGRPRHRASSRPLASRAAVEHHRSDAPGRSPAAGRRPSRRPVRAQTDVHDRARTARDVVGSVRRGSDGRRPHLRPSGARDCLRASAARRTGTPHEHLRRGAERNRALAAWSAIGGVGATAGLVLGGIVTAEIGWRWIFFTNVPVGLVLLALTPLLLGESRERLTGGAFDLRGTATLTAGLALFIYALSEVPNGWCVHRGICCRSARRRRGGLGNRFGTSARARSRRQSPAAAARNPT